MSADPRFLPPTPFARLVRTQAVSAVADACLAASLAGSLFFEGTTSGARSKVLLYLLLTMAPFSIVSPFVGPALDRIRGGRRLLMIVSLLARAVLCGVMARFVTEPSPEGLLTYPLAFLVLVLSKSSGVAKSSLVPSLVEHEEELVRANSRLALTTSIFSAVGGLPAFGVQELFGAEWSLLLAMGVYAAGSVVATKIPRVELVQTPRERSLEREELHQPSILLAGSAMSVLRGGIGFLVFFAAFAFRDDKVALGAVGLLAVVGGFVGNLVAPRARHQAREEVILAAALVASATVVALGGLATGAVGFCLAALAIGVGAAAGRVGFDSLLQRDGPDAVRGRAFARFETQFQLLWVVGALLGLIPVGEGLGLFVLAATLAFVTVSYVGALRAFRSGGQVRTTVRPVAVDRALNRARDEMRIRMRRRALRQGPRGGRAPLAQPQPLDAGAGDTDDGEGDETRTDDG